MKNYFLTLLVPFAWGFATLAPAPCQSSEDEGADRNFGGPDAVENQIADDAKPISALVKERVLDSWFEWKKGVQEDTGIAFGLDYSALALTASDSLGKSNASGGIFRFFGSWELVGRGTKNSGALVWKVEDRHRYGEVPPSGFGLGELGYVGWYQLLGCPPIG